MSRLRLHQLEQSEAACQYAISSPGPAFACVPDIEVDPNLQLLSEGLREKQPVACYVAVRMTMLGHSVPLICAKGFDFLQVSSASLLITENLLWFFVN